MLESPLAWDPQNEILNFQYSQVTSIEVTSLGFWLRVCCSCSRGYLWRCHLSFVSLLKSCSSQVVSSSIKWTWMNKHELEAPHQWEGSFFKLPCFTQPLAWQRMLWSIPARAKSFFEQYTRKLCSILICSSEIHLLECSNNYGGWCLVTGTRES